MLQVKEVGHSADLVDQELPAELDQTPPALGLRLAVCHYFEQLVNVAAELHVWPRHQLQE